MSRATRWSVAIVAVAVAGGVLAQSRGATTAPSGAAAIEVADAAQEALAGGGGLVVRAVDRRAPRRDGQVHAIDGDGSSAPRGRLTCKRLHANPHGGICLRRDRTGVTYEAVVLDDAQRPVTRFAIDGVPDRARIAPDGRHAAYTSFDPEGAAGYFTNTDAFNTYTRIVDTTTGRVVLALEDLRITRGGRAVDTRGAQLWGVDFADDRRFYATAAVGGEHLLVEGAIGSRGARVVRAGIECPALSPDGRRIAYKKRIGRATRWRLHVLDLETGRDVALAERRSIDDQPEWLDEHTVIYSDGRHVLASAADGSGRARRLVEGATSPAPLPTTTPAGYHDDRGPGAETAPSEQLPDGSFEDPPALGNDAVQAEEVVRDVQEGLASGSAISVCRELTVALQRRLARRHRGDCPRAVDAAIARRAAAGPSWRLSKILAVELRHPRLALVTVEDAGRRPFQVRVRRELAGPWELPQVDLDDPTGLVPAAAVRRRP